MKIQKINKYFIEFMKEVYKHQVIDDLQHFKQCHCDDIEKIIDHDGDDSKKK